VSDFAKKTGDYHVLSATDLRVLALTLRLEREARGGDQHLRREPGAPKANVNFYNPASKEDQQKRLAADLKLPGFYVPEGPEEDDKEDEEVEYDGEGEHEKTSHGLDEVSAVRSPASIL